MRLKSLRLTLFFLSLLTLTGCQTHFEPTSSEPEYDSEITIYSGVTMIRPLKQLADEFSAKHNVKVNIHQGASGFLYRTLKKEPQGDIYFPGSNTYRTKSLKDGLISEYVFVGYNRIAMIVAKGNPKKLTADLRQLTNLEYSVVLVPPNAGSIGRSCKRMLDQQGLTNDIYDNVTYFTTDSSRLVKSIVKGDADIALNWYAASKWPEVKDYVDSIQLDNSIAQPQKLELNLLKSSKNPEMARKFLRFVSSKHGLETFHEYGFLTEDELTAAKANASIIYQAEEHS